MKKINKKIAISMIIFVFVILLFGTSLATSLVDKYQGQMYSQTSDVGKDLELVRNLLRSVLKIVRTVGIGIAIIILTVIGIKYMISSAGDRADLKKNSVPYVIGAIIVLSASGIVEIILGFMIKVTPK